MAIRRMTFRELAAAAWRPWACAVALGLSFGMFVFDVAESDFEAAARDAAMVAVSFYGIVVTGRATDRAIGAFYEKQG